MPLHPSVADTLQTLAAEAGAAPLLALGQTVFWDEPLKALLPSVAEEAGFPIRLIAGVHDTDYFAKLPGGLASNKQYVALPKNDGSTKGFWSAAAEFSAMFGGETPVTREAYSDAGVFLEKLAKGDSEFVDKATEAYGWRGIAATDSTPRVAGEIPLSAVFPCLNETLRWALETTVSSLCDGTQQHEGRAEAARLQQIVCETLDGCHGRTLSTFYECLLPQMHKFATGEECVAEITRTFKLLRFARDSWHLPRFEFVSIFLDPATDEAAKGAYDEAVRGTEVYQLARFGTGAIPFDLVIPGVGRGTIRLTPKFLIVMTPQPVFVALKSPIESLEELAAVVERRFGEVALIGKAITLISMLSREFVFAFHEHASMYVSHTRRLHDILLRNGIRVKSNPILRIHLHAWDALEATDRWFQLPEEMRRPFGSEQVSGKTIARSWKTVIEQQQQNLDRMRDARRPRQLVQTLARIKGGRWEPLGEEYEKLSAQLQALRTRTRDIGQQIAGVYEQLRSIKADWQTLEREKGDHFRRTHASGQPSLDDVKARAEFTERIRELRLQRKAARARLADLRAQIAREFQCESAIAARERRREIVREAEMARLRVVRDALITIRALEQSNVRPSAWWMPLVTPDGSWIRGIKERMELRLEPLVGEAT